mgnify:CR=1 FL=1
MVRKIKKVDSNYYCEDDVIWMVDLKNRLKNELNNDEFKSVMRKYWFNCIVRALEKVN